MFKLDKLKINNSLNLQETEKSLEKQEILYDFTRFEVKTTMISKDFLGGEPRLVRVTGMLKSSVDCEVGMIQ